MVIPHFALDVLILAEEQNFVKKFDNT